ncbi:ZIP zinc/iron transport family [Saccharata proteae CBS 121410]|uniref:ZIP zinc/iron transport family n=1 Tax=Saccharata proteae CBS 121410 TaxID=1314787 RepID=A0A9P4HQZ6_9PEZI|nr:ZIP zinc/iron transport family [Saccharata proteae CBS 121410]
MAMFGEAVAQAATLVVHADADTPGHCDGGNDYDGRMGTRISSIFVILIGSSLGAAFPVFARRHQAMGVPEWAFFIAKFFGSGVIIATAFIHLLAPASDNLTNECLTGAITDYDWTEGIVLMTIFVLFFGELMTMRYGKFGQGDHDHSHGVSHSHPEAAQTEVNSISEAKNGALAASPPTVDHQVSGSHVPGDDHLGHGRSHTANESFDKDWEQHGLVPESYAAQLTAVFVLEFGVIFHSVFVGLTLAVSGAEFITLYIVLVFHQTFEGLGLGSRLASVPWPRSKRWTPYWLAIGYGISTPIAIAIGLGVRESYPPNSATTLIVNGVFDSISAGILIYTGLVELMAHEFMFSPSMTHAPLKTLLSAFGLMVLGAGLMALLGEWA